MTFTSVRSPVPASDLLPLAVGLAIRYSPETSAPSADGQRHRIVPLAFRDDLGEGRTVPQTDPVGHDLGQFRVVEVAAGLRVDVFEDAILKAINRAKLPTGLAATWEAESSSVERGVFVTTQAGLLAVALTDTPGFDGAELRIVK